MCLYCVSQHGCRKIEENNGISRPGNPDGSHRNQVERSERFVATRIHVKLSIYKTVLLVVSEVSKEHWKLQTTTNKNYTDTNLRTRKTEIIQNKI